MRSVAVALIDNSEDRDVAEEAIALGRGHYVDADVQVTCLHGHANIGYGTAHNLMLHGTGADYQLVLNPDVELASDALANAIRWLDTHPEVGVAAPAVTRPDGEPDSPCRDDALAARRPARPSMASTADRAVYRAIVLGRLDRMWLGAAELLAMVRRGFRWAGVLGTGGHFGAAGYMELERARSGRRARSTRVFSAQLPITELVEALDAFDPTVLSAYPSVLDVLAREQAAGRLHLRPILVESGAESADAEAKGRISAAFGVPVRDLYGASEFLFAACSCDHDWLHVSSDWVVLEPVDEQARPTPPGEPSHTGCAPRSSLCLTESLLGIDANQSRLQVPLSLAVGGLLDYWVGDLVRAPDWVRRIGHEWLHLLIRQPHKARRYLVGNPKFLLRVARSRLLSLDRSAAS